MTPQELLLATADAITDDNWCQGVLGVPFRRCAAMRLWNLTDQMIGISTVAWDALHLFERHHGKSVIRFNDSAGMKAAKMKQLLREAAT